MSSPEASIEDILASIRKTFTDEPEAPGAKSANHVSEPRTTATMPAFRSASETSVATGAAPLPTPPRSRAAAIDDDLDDLIDKPALGTSAPKLSEPPATPPVSPSANTAVEAAREKWANLLNPHAAANGGATKAAEAKSDSAPQAAPPPTPSSGLFAPRKGGFYPPQDTRSDPVLPMPSAAAELAPAKPAEPAAPVPAPARSFIPFWQPTPATPTPAPSIAAETASAPAVAPAAAVSIEPPAPAPAPAPEIPAASARALDDLVAELNGAAHTVPEPAPPPPVVDTLIAPPASATSFIEQPAPVPVAPEPARLVADPKPAPTPAPAPVAASSLPQAAEGAATPVSATNRSFEDVVADMLRPLLEKWIDENMPRIVERALQRDAALGRKPGP